MNDPKGRNVKIERTEKRRRKEEKRKEMKKREKGKREGRNKINEPERKKCGN